jgi:hypothetical protein
LPYLAYAYSPEYRIARRMLRFGILGINSNEGWKESDELLKEWNKLRPEHEGPVVFPEYDGDSKMEDEELRDSEEDSENDEEEDEHDDIDDDDGEGGVIKIITTNAQITLIASSNATNR